MQAHSPRRTGRAPGAPATGVSAHGGALTEVRLAGRGGQGVVTAGELLGEAVLHSGRHAQSLPTFGPERRGAMAQCTLRIDDEPIRLKCSSAKPSVLVCLDPTIWRYAPITLGLQEDAILVFNTTQDSKALGEALRSRRFLSELIIERFTVHTLDATGIALDTIGRPISNTTMLGAVAGATGLVAMEGLERALHGRFGSAGEANVNAARAGFEAVGGTL